MQNLIVHILTVCLLSCVCAFAQIPSEMNFQGYIVDKATGTPLTDDAEIEVRLYNEEVGSPNSFFWSGAYTVKVTAGIFQVTLGDENNPLFEDVEAFKGEVWLDMVVNPHNSLPISRLPNRIKLKSVPYAAVAKRIESDPLPVGAVIPFAGQHIPENYLLCDGASYAQHAYPLLYEAIGQTHGQGSSGNSFNVPDYRGYFLRGTDRGAGNDPDASGRTKPGDGGPAAAKGDEVGSLQPDALKGHNHGGNAVPQKGLVWQTGSQQYWVNDTQNAYVTRPLVLSFSDQEIVIPNDGGNETRPMNAYVDFIIKAK